MNKTRPFINKYVKWKEQEIIDHYHLGNLESIKPITNNINHKESIVINRSKGDMIIEERLTQIERGNQKMFDRITDVMSKKSVYSYHQPHRKNNKSLNQIYRKKQLHHIELQNKKFISRLQDKKPTYNADLLKKEWTQTKKVMKKMVNYQFNLTKLRSLSRANRSGHTSIDMSQSKTKFDNLRLSKKKIINGVEIVIRIEFTDDFFKIIGDCQDGKDLKIIEIRKNEGITFIDNECNGKIQRIFEKLKYDTKTSTLYLVSETIDQNEAFKEENPEIIQITQEKQIKNGKKNILKVQKNSIKANISLPVVNQKKSKKQQNFTIQKIQNKLHQKSSQGKEEIIPISSIEKHSSKKITNFFHDSLDEIQAKIEQKVNSKILELQLKKEEEIIDKKSESRKSKENMKIEVQEEKYEEQNFEEQEPPSNNDKKLEPLHEKKAEEQAEIEQIMKKEIEVEGVVKRAQETEPANKQMDNEVTNKAEEIHYEEQAEDMAEDIVVEQVPEEQVQAS